jgi:hypothetical protein
MRILAALLKGLSGLIPVVELTCMNRAVMALLPIQQGDRFILTIILPGLLIMVGVVLLVM